MDYGIKTTKAGYNTTETDIRNIIFSSKYSMLKYHSDNSGTATISPGETGCFTNFTHNLGYVPAFIAYHDYPDGEMRYIPGIPRGVGYDAHLYAYTDTTKVRCGLLFDTGTYNQYLQEASGTTNYWDEYQNQSNFWVLGQKNGNIRNGAIRFTSVTIPQGSSISSAVLSYFTEFESTGEPNVVYSRVYGIDEDNTATFTSSPMSRTSTSASTDDTCPLPSGYHDVSVTAIVQEIINRAGWASGNALGFKLYDNGSADQNWVEDDQPTSDNTTLTITYGSSTTINFRVIIFKDKIA